MIRKGKVSQQIEIIHARNEVCEWAPESWVEHRYNDAGKLERRTEVRVLSCKFNEPLPEAQFDIVFPPGTRVWDAAEKQYFKVRADGSAEKQSFRVRADGIAELVPAANKLSTEVSRSKAWYRPYMWLILGLTLATAGVILFIRRRRGIA